VIKNSFIRIRGGHLLPKSCKMVLPSTIHDSREDFKSVSKEDQKEEWPPLLNIVELTTGRASSVPETTHVVQNSKSERHKSEAGQVLIVNGNRKAWFQPSKGLNILFSRAGPKPHCIKSSIKEKLNPSQSTSLQPPIHRRRTYAEALKMDGTGSRRGFGSGRREEDDRGRQHEQQNQNSRGGNANSSDRHPFPGRNTHLRFNPGHDRDRAYGGYAQRWQRQHHPGYRYSGSRVNTDRGRAAPQLGFLQQNSGNKDLSQRSINVTSQAGDQAQQAGHDSQPEPSVPEVFKSQKAGKAKVDEGQSGEGSEPFCFRCYKPGHGKLECKAKLLCDICASNEHFTGRCPILKQPRLMAHLCGYDVNGLGFYHIPHAPVTFGKANNTSALVTVQGGTLSTPQLVAELGRLIPERWQ
jgi:hypothetical protein